MIDGIGQNGPGRVGVARPDKGGAAAPEPVRATAREGSVESAIFEIAAHGAPVDGGRVAALRAAIAEGRYRIDADRIAERMIALDLPQRAS